MIEHRQLLGGIVLGLLIGLAVSGAGLGSTGPPESPINNDDALCSEELGTGWESAGVLHHPDWPVAHIHCDRSPGVFGSEQQWITVSVSEASADD